MFTAVVPLNSSSSAIGYWVIVTTSIALSVAALAWSIWIVRLVRRDRRWFRQGRCLRCGYDVRFSQDRCPECGEPIRHDKPFQTR
jgi:hypothetical protein